MPDSSFTLRRAAIVALTLAAVVGSACGSSNRVADDDGGDTSPEGGSGAESGTAGSGGVSGRAGAGMGGTAGASGTTAGASSTMGGSSDAGGVSPSGGTTGDAGDPGAAGSSPNAGRGGTGGGGMAGTGPRPPFAAKDLCEVPRWLTSAAPPVEATNPVVATSGSGQFVVAYHTSEEVNDFDTWGDGVVLIEQGALNPNWLETLPPEGSTLHAGQVSMGRTGDALWLQNPQLLGANRMFALRRWDQAAYAWDAPHVVPGMSAFGMRSAFLSDQDILVVGPSAPDMIAVVFDHDTRVWSAPEIIGTLGTVAPSWAGTHVALAVDASGNAGVAWTNEKSSGARVMRNGAWVGSAVPLMDDPMIEGFWDVAIAPVGPAEFEVVAGPFDAARGLRLRTFTLGVDISSDQTSVSEPIEARTLAQTYLGAGQPLSMVRDIDGDLTLATVAFTNPPEFWVLRRIAGTWSDPVDLGGGILAGNNDIGMGLQPLALDAGGHVTLLTASADQQLWMRRLEKGVSPWPAGVRVDDDEHRYDGRGASVVLDADENPVVFFSAAGVDGTNVAWTVCH